MAEASEKLAAAALEEHVAEVRRALGGIEVGLVVDREPLDRIDRDARELGELVGKTREAVNKQLRTWAQEGIVETIEA